MNNLNWLNVREKGKYSGDCCINQSGDETITSIYHIVENVNKLCVDWDVVDCAG